MQFVRTLQTLIAGVLVLTPALAGAQSFSRVLTGDLVTIPALYWNGAWGDYDGDGYLDLFVGSTFPSTRNYLYHNNHDGTFTLVDDAKIPKIPSNQHGAAWGDYDNDGHLDLIVTAGNPQVTHNALYHNNGDGSFTAVTDNPIYSETFLHGFHGPSWADYDNDGFLDLFIAGHDVHNRLFRNNGDGTFTRNTTSVLASTLISSEGRAWFDYDDDGRVDLFASAAGAYTAALYHNEGNGVFSTVTGSGLTDTPLDTVAACVADYDNDGFTDVLLANFDTVSLFHNAGNGTFTSVMDGPIATQTIPTGIFTSCAWGDYDNDGFLDLFLGVGSCYPISSPLCQPELHSFLYHNNGDGTFTSETDGTIVTTLVTQTPGASWGDYDNDGFLDLFLSQGATWAPGPVTNMLFHNDGNANAWLDVRLVGAVSNRAAIGAKVRVKAFYRGQSRWQLRTVISGDGESNQSNALNANFGIADATLVDTVRIEWPSGLVQELQNVSPRQLLAITEPSCANGRTFAPRALRLRVNSGSTPADDQLFFSGRFDLPSPAAFPGLDLSTRGAIFVLRNHAGDLRVDAHLPPLSYDRHLRRGWRRSAFGTRWTWLDRTANPIQGIVKLVVSDRGRGAPGGAVNVRVMGKGGRFGIVTGDDPAQAAVVLGQPADAAAGKCAETDFSGSECVFTSSAGRLACAR